MKYQIVRSQKRKGDFFPATELLGTLSVLWGCFSMAQESLSRLSPSLCWDVGCKNSFNKQSRCVSPLKVTQLSCLRSILAYLYF